jgi:hypothetical protein
MHRVARVTIVVVLGTLLLFASACTDDSEPGGTPASAGVDGDDQVAGGTAGASDATTGGVQSEAGTGGNVTGVIEGGGVESNAAQPASEDAAVPNRAEAALAKELAPTPPLSQRVRRVSATARRLRPAAEQRRPVCSVDTLDCSKLDAKSGSGTATFSVELSGEAGNDEQILNGSLDAPGLDLDGLGRSTESYQGLLVDAGTGWVGNWDPTLVPERITLWGENCYGDDGVVGATFVTITLASGAITSFSRHCETDYSTFWYDVTASGTGAALPATDGGCQRSRSVTAAR